MLYILKVLAKILAALYSNSKPISIAAAISFALWLALFPSGNLLWFLLFLIALIFRVNWAMELLFFLIFKVLALPFYPMIESIGWKWLQSDYISNLVYSFYEIPLLSFLGLNNSLVVGGFIWGLILFIPFFALVLILQNIVKKNQNSKPSKWMQKLQKRPSVQYFILSFKQFNGIYK